MKDYFKGNCEKCIGRFVNDTGNDNCLECPLLDCSEEDREELHERDEEEKSNADSRNRW